MGTAGFVIGLLSFITSFIGIGGLLGIFGLIFSFAGLFKNPRCLAITGLILSILGIAIEVVKHRCIEKSGRRSPPIF